MTISNTLSLQSMNSARLYLSNLINIHNFPYGFHKKTTTTWFILFHRTVSNPVFAVGIY